jgi:hypothetical protein
VTAAVSSPSCHLHALTLCGNRLALHPPLHHWNQQCHSDQRRTHHRCVPVDRQNDVDGPLTKAVAEAGNWPTLLHLSNALVARSTGRYQGWGDVVTFAACTGARIGEVSGCRIGDIDTDSWL